MQTGMISTFAGDIMVIGPMYPFVGTEVILTVVSLVGWIVWHICQTRAEMKDTEKTVKLVKDSSEDFGNLDDKRGEW